MAKRYINKNDVIVFDTLDNLVPDDHLVRKLDEFVDWSFIYELTDSLYSDMGRGRIDPVILFKIIFINKFSKNTVAMNCSCKAHCQRKVS